MALVGHISGSSQSQSVIGVTGSVVFANRPASLFPSLTAVGTDAVFFVSGTIGGKAAGLAKTVAVFGGDTVVSGSLTVGTGSVKITSNDIQFGGVGSRIELNGSDLKFFDASNPSGFTLTNLGSGGGGGGASYWFSNVNNETYTTGSVVSSGSILVKGSAGSALVTLDVVSGDVTGSSFRSTGGTFSTSQSAFNLINTTATTVNFAGAATALSIGASASGRTTINNDIATATGNIIGNTAAGPVTLFSSGNIVVKLDVDNNATGHKFEVQDFNGAAKFSVGEDGNSEVANNLIITGTLAVNGSSVTTTNSTMTLFSGATNLNIGGSSSVVTLGSGNTSRVNIPGDLYVQGNVTSIESINTKVKDSLILLGSGSAPATSTPTAIAFASGSVTTNQALVFGAGVGQDILAAVKADVLDGALAISVGTYSSYVPIRASKLELAGPTAFITSSDGTTFTAQGNAANLSATSGVATVLGSTGIILNAQANNISVQNNGGTVLRISGSGASGATLEFKGGPSTTTANLFSDAGTSITAVNFGTQAGTLSFGKSGGTSTFNTDVTGSNFLVNGSSINTAQSNFNLVNTTATTVNFAGAATVLTVGASGAASSTNVRSALTASEGLNVGGPTSADIVTTKTVANLFNTAVTSLNFAGAGTNISVGAAGSGATYLKNASLFVSGATTFGASVLPSADVTWDLGSPTFRWANMYTGDLHLKNDRGDWTIIEEPDFLTITNNRNGKRYKFVMEEIG